MLIMITMFWGASCILTKIGLDGVLELDFKFKLIGKKETIFTKN